MNKNHYGQTLSIEVVTGGFILCYPVVVETLPSGEEVLEQAREVFVSPRKLNQKIKEVLDQIGLVADKPEK